MRCSVRERHFPPDWQIMLERHVFKLPGDPDAIRKSVRLRTASVRASRSGTVQIMSPHRSRGVSVSVCMYVCIYTCFAHTRGL